MSSTTIRIPRPLEPTWLEVISGRLGRINWWIAAAIIIALAALIISVGALRVASRQPKTVTTPVAVKSLPAPAVPVVKSTGPTAGELASATLHDGDGAIRLAKRQLMANPTIVDGTKYQPFTGKAGDSIALKEWAGKVASEIAVSHGFIDKFGANIRFFKKMPYRQAFVLQKTADGNDVQFAVFTAQPGSGFSAAPQRTMGPSTHFLGFKPGTDQRVKLPAGEYLYIPG